MLCSARGSVSGAASVENGVAVLQRIQNRTSTRPRNDTSGGLAAAPVIVVGGGSGSDCLTGTEYQLGTTQTFRR